jgi:lactoylglutathione lyase
VGGHAGPGVTGCEISSSERRNVDEDICTIGSGPWVELDLMQPVDIEKNRQSMPPRSTMWGCGYDDLRAVEWLTAQGVPLCASIRQGAAGFDICSAPKSNAEFPIAGEGRLIELVQAEGDSFTAKTGPLKGA